MLTKIEEDDKFFTVCHIRYVLLALPNLHKFYYGEEWRPDS